jgi:hypothetical protein
MHFSGDRKCPVYQSKGASQEIRVKDSLFFVDAQKK